MQKRDYEKQIKQLKDEIAALKEKNKQLMLQIEEQTRLSDGLKLEVANLSLQAKVKSKV